MHFDTDGIYTLQYTATDSCGNETIEERTVEVISYRTVLYTDGTFIINEKSTDRVANIALHGAVTNEYDPLDPNGSTNRGKYIFSADTDRHWQQEVSLIKNAYFGSPIQPESTALWLHGCANLVTVDTTNLDMSHATNVSDMFGMCPNLETVDVGTWDMSNVTDISYMFKEDLKIRDLDVSNWNTANVTDMAHLFGAIGDTDTFQYLMEFDVSNWDTSKVTNMEYMFKGCSKFTVLDVSNWDTSNVTNMEQMFGRCQRLTELDLSNWDTSNVTNMYRMFAGSYYDTMFKMRTIYASNKFVTTQVTNSTEMFKHMNTKFVGGAGTAWSDTNPLDKTYAHIDGGTADPGYFTAKA